MARAHEQAGLREPADRAAEMGAIDGEHLECSPINIADPAGNVCGFSVQLIRDRVSIGGQARLAGGKQIERAECKP